MTDINQFDYYLPESLIAQRPAPTRSDSRLMRVDRGHNAIEHTQFQKFPELLHPGDTLVLNRTRVFPARLMAKRATGGSIELLLIRSEGEGVWIAMIKGIARLDGGETLNVGDGEVTLTEKLEGGTARLRFASEREVKRLTEKFGQAPLPPYIRREGAIADDEDKERYQTTYADADGSCAAPTAGLHFTEEILTDIQNRGIEIVKIIHHVGPGTFRPIKSDTIEEHKMDAERLEIPTSAADALNRAKSENRRVIAVGSTVTRALESAVGDNGEIRAGGQETSLYITPGHRFKMVDALLTNFHLPKSTLLVLVSAFAGHRLIMRAYEAAKCEKYRFFSYGDAMFIE